MLKEELIESVSFGQKVTSRRKVMIRWNNDYNQGAHPQILEELVKSNTNSYAGYGLDEYCQKAAEVIKKHLGAADADIHFMEGGTQTNMTVIAAALRPYQSVISADIGHVNVHETGAIENTGHKVQPLKHKDGKITAEQIAQEAQSYCSSGTKEHITQPKMVYLSHPTEYGTLYTKEELENIHAVCKEYKLYLFVDGARMGYGLSACGSDVTLEDLARLTDVFYIGGTKCGAALGEAVVIVNEDLKDNFRSYMKQNGGMMAKGWILGIQFYTLFRDGLYFEIAAHADQMAMQIKAAFEEKGIPFYIESVTNQQFVILTEEQMEQIGKNHIFEYQMKVDENHHCVRFCTSWSTVQEDVEILCRDIQNL